MTPAEREVRAWLAESACYCDEIALDGSAKTAALYRAALALLDEARKDKERLEWVLSWLLDKHWTVGHLLGGDVAEMTTAIDQARGA